MRQVKKAGARRAALAILGIGAALVAAAATPVVADIVTLKDGRRYEGKVLEKDDRSVRVDTVAAGLRVELTLPRSDVERVEEAPLPAGFFDPPPAAARAPGATKPAGAPGLYLEVPVIGALGTQFSSEALQPVLAYAKRHGVRHNVFTIDSEGGDLDEAREVYRLLRDYKDSIRFHAIVKRCRGEALAVALWCRPVLVLPGGSIGGLAPRAGASAEEAEEEAILRSRMAERVVADTGASGNLAALIRALLDPQVKLAAWKDEAGALALDEDAPAAVPKERVIFRIGAGEVLSLSREQCLAIGMRDFKGSAADVGPVVKAPVWSAESDFGAKTVARVAAEREKKLQAKQASLDAKVKKVVTRRAEVDQHIQHAIREAAGWDP